MKPPMKLSLSNRKAPVFEIKMRNDDVDSIVQRNNIESELQPMTTTPEKEKENQEDGFVIDSLSN